MDSNSNLFGRFTLANFLRDGPTAFGEGGGPNFVSLGGISDVGNKSLAIGYDRSVSSTLLTDFRFGWFNYKVAVLPFDFGTRPAEAAGIPGLNLDDTFTSGLPALFIEGIGGFKAGSGLDVNRCNCPLDQDESQWQMVGNVTKIWSNHTFKFGVDVRRAHNLRVPSDSHRSGELTFNTDRTRGPSGGGMGLATFLLGDVTFFARYVSTSTDARERQWRHFYYAQDTWRPTPKLTLNYGLRLDIINPQTVNEPGNGGWLDLDTGLINVGGVGDVDLAGNTENSLNWAPRLGATYQIDEKTVIRAATGARTTSASSGRCSATASRRTCRCWRPRNCAAPRTSTPRSPLRRDRPPRSFRRCRRNGQFPLPNGVFRQGAAAEAASADGGRVQRHRAAAAHRHRCRWKWAMSPIGVATSLPAMDRPSAPTNRRSRVSRACRRTSAGRFSRTGRTTYLDLGGAYGWTQGIDYFCNCANNWYDSVQAKFNKRFSDGYALQVNYTWQKAEGEGGGYFFWDRARQRGVQDWDRTHIVNLTLIYELPFGREQAVRRGLVDADGDGVRRLAVQRHPHHSERPAVQRRLRRQRRGSRHRTGPAQSHRRSGGRQDPRSQWFNTTPIGASGQRVW